MPWSALLGERAAPGVVPGGCAVGQEALGAAGRCQMPLPGQWVPLGCRGTAGGAPRPLSLHPLRKIPQTAAEGLPSPPPWGSCSRCSCCSSTPAPAGTHCPRPPAFSPLAAPASSLFFQLPSPCPSPARWSGNDVPSAASGTPWVPPRSPRRPQPKRSRGAGRGSPAERGPGRCPGIAPSRPLGLGKVASVSPARDPSIHLAYFFSLKILKQIFLHRVSNIFTWRPAGFVVSNEDTWGKK